MEHRERIELAIRGEAPPDGRVPVTFWRHFPGDDQSPEDLAAATLAFQQRWDCDLVKISPAASYCASDWGLETRWVGNQEGTREYRRRPIRSAEEWETLQPLDIRRGALADALAAARMVRRQLPSGTPCVWTIFSPLTVLRYLRGAAYLADLREHPSLVEHALGVVTRTYEAFLEALAETGVDGIFFAIQPASFELLSEEEYRQFGVPFDRRLLEAAPAAAITLLHAHGERVMWDVLSGYPIRIINWHDRATTPSLSAARSRFGGALLGGIRQWDTLLQGDPAEVRAEVEDARGQVADRGLIVGAGCVIAITTPERNIRAAIEAARTPLSESR